MIALTALFTMLLPGIAHAARPKRAALNIHGRSDDLEIVNNFQASEGLTISNLAMRSAIVTLASPHDVGSGDNNPKWAAPVFGLRAANFQKFAMKYNLTPIDVDLDMPLDHLMRTEARSRTDTNEDAVTIRQALGGRAVAWAKIVLMQHLLFKFDWLLWVDGDVILNPEASVASLSSMLHHPGDDINLIVSAYKVPSLGLEDNFVTSVFALRGKSTWSDRFLAHVWQSSALGGTNHFLATDNPWEQAAMADYFEVKPYEKKHLLSVPGLSKHVFDFERGDWNMHFGSGGKAGHLYAKNAPDAIESGLYIPDLVPQDARHCARTREFIQQLLSPLDGARDALTSRERAELLYTALCVTESDDVADSFFGSQLRQ